MEEEGEVSDQDTAMPEQELGQQLSDEQNYQQTIRGVRSFMGWHQVSEFGSSASSQDDNLFAGPRRKPTGKVSANYLQMSGCVERWRNSTSLSLKATLPVVLKLSWFLRHRNGMICMLKRRTFPGQKYTVGLMHRQG